jgi:hypothetical protein
VIDAYQVTIVSFMQCLTRNTYLFRRVTLILLLSSLGNKQWPSDCFLS